MVLADHQRTCTGPAAAPVPPSPERPPASAPAPEAPPPARAPRPAEIGPYKCGHCRGDGHNTVNCPNLDQPRAPLPSRGRGLQEQRCGRCKDRGHNARTCDREVVPAAAPPVRAPERHAEIFAGPRRRRRCGKCGSEGHDARSCASPAAEVTAAIVVQAVAVGMEIAADMRAAEPAAEEPEAVADGPTCGFCGTTGHTRKTCAQLSAQLALEARFPDGGAGRRARRFQIFGRWARVRPRSAQRWRWRRAAGDAEAVLQAARDGISRALPTTCYRCRRLGWLTVTLPGVGGNKVNALSCAEHVPERAPDPMAARTAEPEEEEEAETEPAGHPLLPAPRGFQDRRGRRKTGGKLPRTYDVRKVPDLYLDETPDAIHLVCDDERPKTRVDCLPGGINEARPCPWVSCRYHTYLDVTRNDSGKQSLTMNFPGHEVGDYGPTCALDVADAAPATLEQAGQVVNLTRERVRQIEVRALLKMHKRAKAEGIEPQHNDPEDPWRL